MLKIIEPSVEILTPIDALVILKHLEIAGRTCYKSESKIVDHSAETFIASIVKKGHLSVIEHYSLSVRIICDRSITHELVRHRLCSFSQESQRYCNYFGDNFGSKITFIRPVMWGEDTPEYYIWKESLLDSAKNYFKLISMGSAPQWARSVLPNSTKSEIIVTANLRQWLLIFSQRCDSAAHLQMQQVMLPTLQVLSDRLPVIFKPTYDSFVDRYSYFNSNGYTLAEVCCADM